MRHAASGAPHFLARHLPTPIINAGDGTHEHPTQALLDARTILDRRASAGGSAGGDHRRHRAQPGGAVECASAFEVRRARWCCAGRRRCCRVELEQLAPGVTLTNDMREAIRDADVIMMLRVQLERQHEAAFPAGEYFRFYGLRLEHMELAQAGRDRDASGPDQSRAGDFVGSGGFPALGDFESGGERDRGAHGGAGTSAGSGANAALLIKNGRVIDPGVSGIDAVADVLIEDGMIAASARTLIASGRGSIRRVGLDCRAGLHRHARASARAWFRARRDHRDRVARGGGGRIHVHLLHAEHAAGER